MRKRRRKKYEMCVVDTFPQQQGVEEERAANVHTEHPYEEEASTTKTAEPPKEPFFFSRALENACSLLPWEIRWKDDDGQNGGGTCVRERVSKKRGAPRPLKLHWQEQRENEAKNDSKKTTIQQKTTQTGFTISVIHACRLASGKNEDEYAGVEEVEVEAVVWEGV
ncbi:hypothetical protein BKA81DRAFT_111552 [Phyllosticta paracitricarpa]